MPVWLSRNFSASSGLLKSFASSLLPVVWPSGFT